VNPCRRLFPVAAALMMVPQVAQAHGSIEGAGDFYGGLLHPFLAPPELLAIIASGLLIGRSGLAACRYAIPTLACAVGAGLVLGWSAILAVEMTTPLALAAFVAAVFVTTGLRAPSPAAVAIALVAGLAVGFDAAPETGARMSALVGGAATVLASAALVTITAALALRAEKHWQRVAAQIAGSWITASAVLYLAFRFAPHR